MRRFMLVAVLVGSATSAWADPPARKPGLWEVTHTSKMDGKPLAQPSMPSLENMPPEARARMEKMMNARGMSMPSPGPQGGQVAKICLDKEVAERKEPPLHQSPDASCTHKVTQQTADTVSFTFACKGRRATRGQGQAKFDSAERYSGWVETVSEEKSQAHTMRMDYSARWIGGDCANLKPLSMPKN